MSLRQKLATFLEFRQLKELRDTDLVVLFEFLRGELKKTRLWKFIAITKLIGNKYKITVPKSVDRMTGNYAEKTQYIQESERDLAESLMEALEFRLVTLTSSTVNDVDEWKGEEGRMQLNVDTLDPRAHTLTYWIVYGDSIPHEAVIKSEDDGLTFKYKGYEVQIYGDYVTKCIIPDIA